jgi:tetratricopeptide (TPR) repeat protein
VDPANRIDRLERFLEADPSNPVLLRDLARAYHQQGEQDKALELCARLTKLEGESATTLNLVASAHLARSRWDEAASVFTKAIALDASVAALHFNLGYAELARGRAAEAARAFERAIELEPANSRFHTHLKLARDDLGDKEGARQALAKALALDPGNVDANLLAAYEEIESGRVESAQRIAETAVQRNPESPMALGLRADMSLLALDPERALPDLRRATALRPNDAQLQASLGQALLALRRLGEAEQALNKAAQLDPDLSTAYIGLGWARLLQENVAGAKDAFARALSRRGAIAEAHAGMALVCAREQRMAEFEREIDTALRVDPKCATALWLRSGLAQLKGDSEGARRLAQQFLDQRSAGPLGWSNRELLERAASSPATRSLRESLRTQRPPEGGGSSKPS